MKYDDFYMTAWLKDVLQNSGTNKHKFNVAKYPELVQWINEKTKDEPADSSFLQRIYVALTGLSSKCGTGNFKKFSGSLVVGFGHCGNVHVCVCAKENHSSKIKNAKQNMSDEAIMVSNERRRKTNFAKYGYEFTGQVPEYKDKIKQTNIEKYGHSTNLLNAECIDKIKNTLISRYGVDNPSKSSKIREKTEKTNLEKYGNVCSLQATEIRDKIIERNQNLYGVSFFHRAMFNEIQEEFLSDKNRFIDEVSKYGVLAVSKKYDIHPDRICTRLNTWGISYDKRYSKPEEFIKKILDDENIEYDFRNRKIISPYELDFVIPNMCIAIEVCGLYWHSEKFIDKNYHIKKLELCAEKGYDLITIFSDEIDNTPNIVISRLRHILKCNNKAIYARKCIIKEIDMNISKEFLNKYHLMGNAKSKIKLGAFFENQLVAVMTFNENRQFTGDKSKYIELVRFAVAIPVTGIASKMFNYFIKNYNFEKIVTYADRRWSTGNMYKKLGFIQTKVSLPNYWYTQKFIEREHRYNYTKARLVELGYDKTLSETEIMKQAGYSKVWDCGTIRFEYTAKRDVI